MVWNYVLLSYRRLAVTLLQILIPTVVMLILVLSVTYHFHWELSGQAQIELTQAAQRKDFP